MEYREVVPTMRASLPEIRDGYNSLQAEIGPEVLPHMIVALVLEPFVKDLLQSACDEKLRRRTFAFFEEMACSSDPEVVSLLQIGVFETWVGDPEILREAWKYLGDRSTSLAEDTARALTCGKNLPRRWWQPL